MPSTRLYRVLQQSKGTHEPCFVMDSLTLDSVTADSPATQVMTDLSRIPTATISTNVLLEQANRVMIQRSVRLLVVTDDEGQIAGIVTSNDILGEKPVAVAHNRGVKRSDLTVADIMVPVDKLDALPYEEVRKALVGDIVATLKTAGRAHALVVGPDAGGRQILRGIFSASQIARQLGLPPLPAHEIARTFAEIEAVMVGV